MSATPLLADALPQAELLHDRASIEAAIERIAARIDNDYANHRPLYLTVMHGGMLFASLLALKIRTVESDGALAGNPMPPPVTTESSALPN